MTELRTITVLAYFEDPGLQQTLKQLLQVPENKSMLLKYEQSLPSWTVVLAQYTGNYHPWMRHSVRIIAFLASCITVSIGFYDLYRHFPVFQVFLNSTYAVWVDWLKEIVAIRITLFCNFLFYFQTPFLAFFETFIEYETLMTGIYYLFYPLICLCQTIVAILTLIWEMFLPLKAVVSLFLRTSWSAIWALISLPFNLVYYIYLLCSNSLLGFLSVG